MEEGRRHFAEAAAGHSGQPAQRQSPQLSTDGALIATMDHPRREQRRQGAAGSQDESRIHASRSELQGIQRPSIRGNNRPKRRGARVERRRRPTAEPAARTAPSPTTPPTHPAESVAIAEPSGRGTGGWEGSPVTRTAARCRLAAFCGSAAAAGAMCKGRPEGDETRNPQGRRAAREPQAAAERGEGKEEPDRDGWVSGLGGRVGAGGVWARTKLP